MFTFLVFLSAFLLESIGTYVSVIGLGALFAYSPIVMTMAVALDVAKITTVTFLYRHWKQIGWTMRSYMLTASFVLMVITSSGVFGYLSGEFQKAIASNTQQTVLIEALSDEHGRLQKRKEEIDKQISQLPQNYVRARRQLMQEFGPEVSRINERLAEIDKKLPELKIQNIDKDVHVGPIMYVAEAFKTTPQEAVKWVILTIIGVFDPLAIALIVAGNFLLSLRKKPEVKGIHGNPEFTIERVAEKFQEALDKRDESVPLDFHAPPQQKTLQELIDKIDNRKFEPTPPPIPEAPVVREEIEPKPEPVNREKVVIKAPPKKPRKVQVAEADGKEVITLTPEPLRRSSLENVSTKADVESIQDSISSNSIRTYRD